MKTIFRMAVFTMMFVFASAFAQEAKAPDVPDSAKVKLLEAKLKMAQLNAEWVQCQKRISEIPGEFQKAQFDFNVAEEQAYKDAKVDKKDWSIDPNTLVFVKVAPKPAEPAKK